MEQQSELLAKIKGRVMQGDYTAVAQIVGLKADTVRKVVSGKRHNDRVVAAFKEYLNKRDALRTKFSKEATK